jgi:hypothetical protein
VEAAPHGGVDVILYQTSFLLPNHNYNLSFSTAKTLSSKLTFPGFVDKSKELRAKGVNTIACIFINDAFVMKA